MKRIITALTLTIATISIVHTAAAQPQASFRVVVHPENPANSATRLEVARWMLKTNGRWPDGERVQPIDQKVNDTRKAFSTDVLGRDLRNVQRYWQRQIFSARSLPPPEVSDDQAVIAFVRQNRGGIGYVSGAANLSGVKQLTVGDRQGSDS